MKLLLILTSLLISGGCGYADKKECELKEIQECKGVEGYQCQNLAKEFCAKKFPYKEKKLSKEEKEERAKFRKIYGTYDKEQSECKEQDGGIFKGRCETSLTAYTECLKSNKSASSCKGLGLPKSALFCILEEDKDWYLYLLWTSSVDGGGAAELYLKNSEIVRGGELISSNTDYYSFKFGKREHLNPYYELNRKDLRLNHDETNYSCSITTVENATNAIKRDITEILNEHDQLNQI